MPTQSTNPGGHRGGRVRCCGVGRVEPEPTEEGIPFLGADGQSLCPILS